MVDACEDEQTALLRKYVLSRLEDLEQFADAEDSAFGPLSVSPFVPCAAGRIPYVLQAARLGPEDVLWDLGCGDGVVLIEAARRCGCRCVGLDIDGPCIAAARQRAREANVEERCTWLRCDLLQLPQGTLAGLSAEQEFQSLPAATCALVFLTAHGLVRLSRWLHEEWREGSSRQLRLVTCVESLDSAVDFNEPDALFADPNELDWPVCRDLERWGVFVVPPFGQDTASWSSGIPPLHLTRMEAEATQAAVLPMLLTEEQVHQLDTLGSKLLVHSADGDEGEVDIFAHSEVSFHKAAEAALHRLGQHRVLYLHSEEVTAQLSNEERAFLQVLEETITARMRAEDSCRWGLLGRRAVTLRSMEYHAYEDGGSVMDPEHRDDGSLLTISVLLSRRSSFEGGIFNTFLEDSRVEHCLDIGDAVLFVSEKRHNVSPVMGQRQALVLELWDGLRNHRGRHD